MSAGLPSTSILWGPWATGMAASDPRIGASFERAGMMLLRPAQGLGLLQRITAQRSAAAQVLAVPVQWSRLLANQRPVPAMFAAVLAAAEANAASMPAAVPQLSSGAAAGTMPVRQQQQQQQPQKQLGEPPAASASLPDIQQQILTIAREMVGRSIGLDEVCTTSSPVCCILA